MNIFKKIFNYFTCKHDYKYIYNTFKHIGFSEKTLEQYENELDIDEIQYELIYKRNFCMF